MGTIDSVFDTKPAPFRILHHTPTSEVFYGRTMALVFALSRVKIPFLLPEIACDLTREGIMKNWQWLAANLFRVLNQMESEEEVTNFVICKVQSLVTHTNNQIAEEEPVASASDQVVISKFKDLFQLPDAEQLVSYYSCK